MKTVHWLFLLSVILFVSGIGFIVAGARESRRSAPVVSVPATTPVASVKQIMKGIVEPNALAVYKAVGSTETAKGVEEWAPKTEAEWETVGNNAAALIESGNLLLMGSRVVDQQDWVRLTRMMIDGAKQALTAAQAKNAGGVMAAGEPINNSCDACHEKYERH
jgi:hypothetical protein